MEDINYFTCTLGQAIQVNGHEPIPYETIIEFLEYQAQIAPNQPAVGFPNPHVGSPNGKSRGNWGHTLYSFKKLHQYSLASAEHLGNLVSPIASGEESKHGSQTVALLCPSSIEFLFSWLGLMQMGYSVLLVAPQCQPLAISHLCKTCDVKCLVYDEAYADLAHRTEDIHHDHLETVQIPQDFIGSIEKPNDPQGGLRSSGKPSRKGSPSDIAFLFHTSGTSSGLPKPIPQTQHGVIGVLPFRLDGHESATFSTTPLYHGGISDCFRAWTSNALVWLFPGKDVPITPTNVLKCLESTVSVEKGLDTPPVKYFSSVPYILQMVAAEVEGMKMLQRMAMVGVGGAALPQETGDGLVQKGVNLVSRFGSAECGFLLSSHREYERDKDWQYLRNQSLDLLKLEPQDDESGLSELVIQSSWPHMAKRNRDDGSFATADLLAPHPTIRNAWKYHSRADSQLTLITGKKFDPVPLEAAIATNSLLSDVLIFGNGMQQPGALLFRSDAAKEMTERGLLNQLWPVVESLNKQGQAHTRIARSMLLVMPADAPGLEKSSKGTVLRGQAERRYEKKIQGAYEHRDDSANGDHGRREDVVPDYEVPTTVLEIIKDVIGTSDPIPEDADLFSFGVDSVACMAIRARLQSRILEPEVTALPLNVVYDCGNIKRLSGYLTDLRKGKVTESEDEIQLMRDLVEQYSNFSDPSMNSPEANVNVENPITTNDPLSSEDEGEHVILTGATGSLGAHILHLLRSSPSVLSSRKISSITCLVRATSHLAAHGRVSKSLIARAKPGLPPFNSSTSPENMKNGASSHAGQRVNCVPCTLSSPTLGLDPTTYMHLARTTTLIVHAAWAVNFTARLRSFVKDHIGGLKNLLDFTISPSSSSSHEDQREDALLQQQQQARKKDGNNKKKARFLFLSSTASITFTPPPHQPIAEHISQNPTDASPLGYSRSKWVAENICARFHAHIHTHNTNTHTHQQSTSKIDIAILRIGQLTGDTESGIWNMSEAYPLMLSTAPLLRALPDLPNTPLEWLPVDIAANAIIEIAAKTPLPQTQNTITPSLSGPPTTTTSCPVPVLHILNPSTEPTWRDLLHTIENHSSELNIRTLPPGKWLEALEHYGKEISAKKLVGLWRDAFSSFSAQDAGGMGRDGKGKGDGKGEAEGRVRFAMEKTRGASGVMDGVMGGVGGEVGMFEEGFLGKVWVWVLRECEQGAQ